MRRLGLIEMVVLTALATLTAAGCPGDDGSTDSGAGSTTNTASSTAAPASTGAEATTEPATSAGTMGGSGSGSTSMAADDTTTGSVGPVMCADTTCETGQVCVHPCGGGAQPPCEAPEANGTCPPGYVPDQDGLCPEPCGNGPCCAPEPEDLTPFCLGTEELMCNGTTCEAPSCVAGELQDGQLQCGCPP